MFFPCTSRNMAEFFFSEPHDKNDYNFCRAECKQTDRILVLLQKVLDFGVFMINGRVTKVRDMPLSLRLL